MKNTSIIGVVLVVLVLGGVGVFAFMNQADTARSKPDSMEKTETAMQPETKKDDKMMANEAADKKADVMMDSSDEKMMKKEGAYAPFSPELLANSTSTRRVLFFYANWCPTCKPADKSFSDNLSEIPADVTLIRVNYNDNETDRAEKELAKKYGITYQHTFVQIDAQGNEVSKWNGGKIDELLSNVK